ncbi:MAG: hypothetical protein ACD_3C00040G0002 [uncultured bacterium (gcode 4)]|uniref:Peptidase S54 rhomboid domain-containing protein n=1 Tax=uncultured bacterium (gcode 4) TaxID=1234023 RepID=K2FBZ5_9BACT|nr:MAG: hypothetical protein ACD_3C00040G0002 [uncultured bacterium (gcode 4)]
MEQSKSISNMLILISIFITSLTIPFQQLYNYWMNNYYLGNWDYLTLLIQFCLYQFLHWWLLHILSNSIFIYLFWNQVERLLWKKRFLMFFLLNTIFTWVAILILSEWNTVGISWFAMAVMWYVFMYMRKIRHPDYKWAWTFLALNILIWFSSNISLVWHLWWAVFGCLFFIFESNLKKKKFNKKIYEL